MIRYDDVTYMDSKELKCRVFENHKIPALRVMAFRQTNRAIAPLPNHIHTNAFEFTYVIEGNVTFSVDGQVYPVAGGDVFVAFPNEVHSTGGASMSRHQMYWIQLEMDDPDHFLFMHPDKARWLIDRLMDIPRRHFQADINTKRILEEILADIDSKDEVAHMQAAFLLETLLCQFIRDAKGGDRPVSEDIGKAQEYIHKHLHGSISLEDLSSIARLSESRLKQKFKDETGMSPRNYINYHKIQISKQMLADGLTVSDIATSLGFSSSDYFSVVFHRYVAMSPTEYASIAREAC